MSFTLETARGLLAETAPSLDWSAITPEASLADAGLDSLDKATFFMKVEENTGATIPDEVYEELDTIAAVIDFLAA